VKINPTKEIFFVMKTMTSFNRFINECRFCERWCVSGIRNDIDKIKAALCRKMVLQSVIVIDYMFYEYSLVTSVFMTAFLKLLFDL